MGNEPKVMQNGHLHPVKQAEKHAYLIMCHNNWRILKILVSLLDDPRNDIYIHVDRKVRRFKQLKREISVNKATLVFTKRIRVNWGGFSQIRAELLLLQAATKREHAYYHLISGVDMPLKTQDEIHAFFKENRGSEFLGIDEESTDGTLFAGRIGCYHFFQDWIGRNKGIGAALAERAERISLGLQRKLRVDRLERQEQAVYKGPNWFSITHSMAAYVLQSRRKIYKVFRFSLCADELFLQTTAMHSPYQENIVKDALREIDWSRGAPYIFRGKDFYELINSRKLFARKFDEAVDFNIVLRIRKMLQSPHCCNNAQQKYR